MPELRKLCDTWQAAEDAYYDALALFQMEQSNAASEAVTNARLEYDAAEAALRDAEQVRPMAT